jgi:polysaccharide biosynthesis protein PslH
LNLLVLTPLIPYPPHDGDKLRLYHLLKHLKSRGHVIDLFCITRVKDDFQYAEELRPLCRRIYLEHISSTDLFFNLVGGGLLGQSFNVSSYFSPQLRETLKAYWQSKDGLAVDVVLAHRLRMAPAAFEGNPGKPVVLELTDCLTTYTSQLKAQPGARFSRRVAAWWDYWFLRKEEVEWSERAAKTLVISEPDAQALRELGLPSDKVEVIGNGVDVPKRSKASRPGLYPKQAPVVCFVGNMGYAPNEDGARWFLKEVWPQVKSRVPKAVFAMVGGQPRKALRKFHNGQDIFVTGWVPEIAPYVQQATVTIAPLRLTAGMQNKVALSLSLGVPVVATRGAVAWLPLKGREGLKIAEDAGLFAEQVIESLLKPRQARAQALKGKRFILRNYRWNKAGQKLEAVLKMAIKRTSGRKS